MGLWDVAKAFSALGCEATWFEGTDPDLIENVDNFAPDLIYTEQSTGKIARALPKARIWYAVNDCFVVMGKPMHDRVVRNAERADFVSCNSLMSSSYLGDLTKRKVYHMPVPIDADVMQQDKASKQKTHDLCFIGTKKTHRINVLNSLGERYSCACYGRGYRHIASYEEFPRYLKGHVNLNLRERDDWPMTISTRVARLLACGEFVLSEKGDLEPFVVGEHLMACETKDLEEVIDEYLRNPDNYDHIKWAGHQYVMRELTLEATARRMLRIVDGRE